MRKTQKSSRRGSNVVGALRPLDRDEHLEKEIHQLSDSPDSSDYASLLQKCKVLVLGKQVHDHISRSRHASSTFLNNLLIHMYSGCGSIHNACSVFETMKRRNIYSWNIMIAAYAHNGHTLMARSLFETMPRRDVSSWTSGITLYARDGSLQQARALFEEILQPDVTAWNAIISAYAQNGHPIEARELFLRADVEGVVADAVTLICMLDACDDQTLGKLIHSEAELTGLLQSNITLGTALVTMYGRCNNLNLATATFTTMPRRNDVTWSAMTSGFAQNGRLEEAVRTYKIIPHHCSVAANTIISAYLQSGCLEDAKDIFDCMPEKDIVSWTAMLSGYTQAGCMQLAAEFFHGMPRKNVSSWNTMISSYVQNGIPDKAVQLFKRMDIEGFKPDALTFPSVFEACSFLSRLQFGSILHAEFISCSFTVDVYVGTSLITMYGSCGSLEDAEAVFTSMPRHNAVVWNALMAVYDHNGFGEKALDRFQDMELEGEVPDSITFITTLAACSHVGRLENGRKFFFSMVGDYGIQPVLDHYQCVVDLFGRAGLLHEAEELLESMPYVPDDVAWTTFLAASCVLGDFRKGSVAADRGVNTDPADSSFYVLLSNVFSSRTSGGGPKSLIPELIS